jgi:N utilization substance protein B
MGKGPKTRTRTASRVAAVQALFQSEQAGDSPETVIDQFVRHRLGGEEYEDGQVPDAEVTLFTRVVREASRRQDTVDKLMVEALPEEWPLARLDPVLRALLRAAGAELAMTDGPPAKVVINEYLDVARGFFTGPEPGMANAVLDRMARGLRTAEF